MIIFSPKFLTNEEIMSGMVPGTLITNFMASDLGRFTQIISFFPEIEFEICQEAFDVNGNELEGMFSLHCKSDIKDLSEFWSKFRYIE